MKGSIKVTQSLVLFSMVGAFQMPTYHSSSRITGMKHLNRPVIPKHGNVYDNVLVNSPSAKKYRNTNDFQLSVASEFVAESGTMLSLASASVLSNPLGLGIWSLLPTIYALGRDSTEICEKDLTEMRDDPNFEPYFKGWDHLRDVNGIGAILNHLKFGSPSILMYVGASFFAFPLIDAGGISAEVGSLLTIVASALFFVCMACMTPVLLNELKKNFSLQSTAGCIILLVTTLPCFQLATWQIEYALRILNGNPTDMVLPDLWLNFMHITNTLRPLINPMNSLYDNSIFPETFNAAGHAMVNSMADADKYANPSDIPATKLTMNDLTALNQGLMVGVVYGLIAPFPTLAAITNFGFEKVNISKCPISEAILKVLGQKNFADLNLNDVGLYLVITVVWTLLGTQLLASYVY